MKKQIKISSEGRAGSPPPAGHSRGDGAHGVTRPAAAFTLIEVMVVMALLSFIVIALMTVFNSTQAAFRASVTQTDVLESGRATMELITQDLRAMAPSMGTSNFAKAGNIYYGPGPVNFYAGTNYYANPPLIQPLVASSGSRTNINQDFFVLSRGNLNGVPIWTGTGYAVCLSPSNTYSLYRFSTNRPVAQNMSASNLFWTDFQNFCAYPNSGSYSHLLDGVVGFQLRTFDAGGNLILTNRMNIYTNAVGYSLPGLKGLNYPGHSVYFFSNALPASVEIEMATIEDRALLRADSAIFFAARSNYLAQQAGRVHVFRQRVAVPNVDPSVYR